jgi:hypothetical protein
MALSVLTKVLYNASAARSDGHRNSWLDWRLPRAISATVTEVLPVIQSISPTTVLLASRYLLGCNPPSAGSEGRLQLG